MGGMKMIKENMLCILGRHDIPAIQEQPLFMVDLLQSNVMLVGSSMSGKTNLIKLMITILHKKYRETDEQIFILDFGGALADFEYLPLVAAYFDNANEEYVKRVFKLVEDQLKENIIVLKGKNYVSGGENQPIHTTLFIDNINAFLDEPRYSAYQEKLAKLCRDGLSKGITIVVTGSSTKGLSSYMNSFKQKIALDIPADSYMDIFNHKVIPVGNNQGHGYANVTVIPPDIKSTFPIQMAYEMQLHKSDDIYSSIFAENLNRYFEDRCVKKYKRFPDTLTDKEFFNFIGATDVDSMTSDRIVSIGLDYTECKTYCIDFSNTKVIAIYGKKEFGKTNLLRRLLSNILKDEYYHFVFFDDGREQLKKGLADTVPVGKRNTYICGYQDTAMTNKNGTENVKLSPIQLFIKHIHEYYMDLSNVKRMGSSVLKEIFGTGTVMESMVNSNIRKNTVFVLQSKFLYVHSYAAKIFMEIILPSLAARAEENNWIFIFSDVKNISDSDDRDYFNSSIETAFLLDNIAEFVSERGSKSVFGNMDVKSLKEEYARCEVGDGYVYSIEKDELKKLKFIKENEV